MIKGSVSIGDILYEPRKGLVVEVTAFGEDNFGQKAIEYKVSPRKTNYTTAFFVFKYFYRLGRV